MNSTMVFTIDPARVKELMTERGLDVPALAADAGVTAKTIYSLLGGTPVSLATAGKVFRALGPGNREGFFAGKPTPVAAGAA